jgi:hypothetical protein
VSWKAHTEIGPRPGSPGYRGAVGILLLTFAARSGVLSLMLCASAACLATWCSALL